MGKGIFRPSRWLWLRNPCTGFDATEIFERIYQFLLFISKVKIRRLVISGNIGPTLTKFLHHVEGSSLLQRRSSILRYSNSFWNACASNEGRYAIVPQNWLPRQRPLRYREKKGQIYNVRSNIYCLLKKNRENRSSGFWDNWSTISHYKKREKKFRSKIYNSPAAIQKTVTL